MAKFFVGQRVRILWSTGWPELAGQEGRIIKPASDEPSVEGSNNCEWVVAPDCWGSECAPRAGTKGGARFAPSSDQLEPILPEGAHPLGYSFKQMMSEFGVKEGVN